MNSDQVERTLFSLTGSVEAVRATTISGTHISGQEQSQQSQQSQQSHQSKANLSTPNTVNSSNEQSATTK
jgi:hypothetical protein